MLRMFCTATIMEYIKEVIVKEFTNFLSSNCGMVAVETFIYTVCTFMLFSVICKWYSEIKKSFENINKKEDDYHANIPTIRRIR